MRQNTKNLKNRLENVLSNEFENRESYLEQLKSFNDIIVSGIFGKDSHEHYLRDVISYIDSEAIRQSKENNEVVRKCIDELRAVDKTSRITFAGEKAERRADKSIKYFLQDNCNNYPNIYVSDDEQETEIDQVVLTKTGIYIIEVKSVKDKIYLSKEGRILKSNHEALSRSKTIREIFSKKHYLLEKEMKKQLKERGIFIPIIYKDVLLFSTKDAKPIEVINDYGKCKYVFQNQLKSLLHYPLRSTEYTDDELAILNDILSNMKTKVKKFRVDHDYNLIKEHLYQTMDLLNINPTKLSCSKITSKVEKSVAKLIKLPFKVVLAPFALMFMLVLDIFNK